MSNKLIIVQTAYAIAKAQFGDKYFTKKKMKKYRTIAQWIGIYVFKIVQKNLPYRDTEDDLYGWSGILVSSNVWRKDTKTKMVKKTKDII